MNTEAPSISGTPEQGDTLTAHNGTWTGDTPMTFSYAWSDGQSGKTITLGSGDVGQTITATVTATNDACPCTKNTATSAGVGPVTASPPPPPPVPPSNTVAPAISGTPQQGDQLTSPTAPGPATRR